MNLLKRLSMIMLVVCLSLTSFIVSFADENATVDNFDMMEEIDLSEILAGLEPIYDEGSLSRLAVQYYKVTANGVRLRKTAGTSGTILGTLAKGTKVQLRQTGVVSKNGYYWMNVTVRSGANNGKVGWVAVSYLN